LARHQGEVVFVEGGVPGDRARVHVYGKKKKVLAGRVEELLSPSEKRSEPRCPHFGHCGGCKWQHMDYTAQLAYKEKQVRDSLERIGKVSWEEFHPILGNEEIYHYRNKLEFTFSSKAWLTLDQIQSQQAFDHRVLGFHGPRSFEKVLNIETCKLQATLNDAIRNELRAFARQEAIPFYDIRANEGFLRTLTLRSSLYQNQFMAILVVAHPDLGRVDHIFSHLAAKFPQITSFIWIHNPKLNSSYNDLPYHVWQGEDHLIEQLGTYRFKIRPVSFFQTNPRQAEVLYQVVRRFLLKTMAEGQAKHSLIFDLYSGTGSIGIFLEQFANRIVGIEYVDSAVQDAWENVRLNQLEEDRFHFYAGDMKDLLKEDRVKAHGQPSVVVTDPPRQGMDAKVVKRLLELNPKHIIYVSCKPSTQARDLALMDHQYVLTEVQPVDMFPHTAHVENVVLLQRRPRPKPLVESQP
ncbi:MAG: 23S rRNA (uracil(1939)-C(5))-methyltransferase RlmD, partial [Bacteroidota bacterium]